MSIFGSLFTPKRRNVRFVSNELKELEEEFDGTAKLYEAILPALKGMHQHQSSNVKKLSEFSTAMSSHGSSEKHPLSKVFEKCAEAHRGLADEQKVYLEKYKANILEPVVHFLEKDIKDVRAKRKTFYAEISKQESKEASVAKLQQGGVEKADKLRVAKIELEALEKKCDELAAQLLTTYVETLHKKREQLTTIMREMGMMHMEHLDSSIRVLEAPHKEIESLSISVLTERPKANSGTVWPPQESETPASNQIPAAVENPFLESDEE